RTMDDGLVHGEILEVELFVADYYVDVVLAPQAMVGDRQQTVDVGWKVDASYFGPFVSDYVDKSRILMSEAVVILPPDRRGDKQIERCDVASPGQVVTDRQPLCVLIEHGVDDMRESLVGGKEAMPPGENITLQHPFDRVLAEHLNDASIIR